MTGGYGESLINPEIGCFLCGYGVYLDRKAEGLLDDLKIRVVFLEDEKGNKILLCSFDLIGFSVDFTDQIREEISKKFNIPFENIFISCIHTHSGPTTINLRAMGEIDTSYMNFLKENLIKAVEKAINETSEVEIKWKIEEIEPISYNRVNNKLEPLDLNLGVIILKKENEKIYIINYACHPVTLGVNKEISADLPGRIIKEIEKRRHKGIFFQGFCGDINPFVFKVKWGSGTEKDIDFYGKHISERMFRIEESAYPLKEEKIICIEKRIKVPLNVKDEKNLKKEVERLLKKREDEKWKKFIENWYDETLKILPKLLKNPYLENVPVWVGKIGEIKLVGLPGEVFCEIGLKLRKKYSNLFLFGYGNGDIGYIPTKKAYKNKNSYECYGATMFYNNFPFKPEIENIFLKKIKEILKRF